MSNSSTFTGAVLFTSDGKVGSIRFIPITHVEDTVQVKEEVTKYMQSNNIDSTELVACLIGKEVLSLTVDSIFQTTEDYLADSANVLNQQYSEYLDTMFDSCNQPSSQIGE